MSKLNPSWTKWRTGERPDIKSSAQSKPPVQNKNKAQNSEVADVKSATETAISTATTYAKSVSPYDKYQPTKEDIQEDAKDERNEAYQYEKEINDNRIDDILNMFSNKFLTLPETEDKSFNLTKKFINGGDGNGATKNVAISAKKTKALRSISKYKLQKAREFARDNVHDRDWKLNPNPVSSEFTLRGLRNRKLASNLALLFSKVAEERIGDKIAGRHKWDVEKIMFRRISKKLITHCKYSRDKEKIIIILDSSPSCSRMANLYSQISTEACKYEHVELYDAPNGYIHSKYCISERKYVPLEDEELDKTYHWLGFENRTIIFFGDEDANDTLIKAYKQNEIHFFLRSGRNSYAKQHVKDVRKKWEGKLKVYECNTTEQILKAVREMK